MITPKTFMRRSFEVEAIRVTSENMEEVAQWCLGTILIQKRPTKRGEGGFIKEVPYLKVDVLRPLNERQTMAFPGDWILKTGTSFKIYTDIAFHKNFLPMDGEVEQQEEFNVPFEQLSDFMVYKDGSWEPMTNEDLKEKLGPIIRATMSEIQYEHAQEVYTQEIDRMAEGFPQVKLGGLPKTPE